MQRFVKILNQSEINWPLRVLSIVMSDQFYWENTPVPFRTHWCNKISKQSVIKTLRNLLRVMIEYYILLDKQIFNAIRERKTKNDLTFLFRFKEIRIALIECHKKIWCAFYPHPNFWKSTFDRLSFPIWKLLLNTKFQC